MNVTQIKNYKEKLMNKKHYNFRMDMSLHNKLDQICKKNPMLTKTKIVHTAIKEFLENNFKECIDK